MSRMQIGIDLLDSTEDINRKILKAIAEDFNARMSQKRGSIEARVRDATIELFKATDTYESLINGELAAHFGLPANSRKAMVDSIIDKIGDSIVVDVHPVKQFGDKFRGQSVIKILIKDFSDILSMSQAFISTEKGGSLPWLEWLLIRGDTLIVSEHDIRLVDGKGRSGLGIMVKNSASAWRVSPQYSGTRADNWLTRTLSINQDQFLNTITNILKQELE